MDINRLREKLNQITHEKVKGEFQKVIRATLNTEVTDFVYDNWSLGYKGNQERIGVYRSEEYRQEKLQMNSAAGGNVDLIYSGSFANSLFIPQDENIINVDARDDKRNKLVNWYGEGIFDLSTDQEFDIIDEATLLVYEELFKFING